MATLFKSPKIPDPEPPAPLPDEDEIMRATRRQVARQQRGSGVQSTILSTGGRETLGA